jgi:hypothetical protein
MRIEFDITSADDARKAAGICAALAEFLGGKSRGPVPSQPPATPPVVADVTPPLTDVAPPPPPVIPDDITEARKLLQEVARSKGVTWLRQQIAEHGVKRLTDLPDEAVHPLLRKAVAGG